MRNILIFAINKYWLGISRLPQALKDSGFKVIVICPAQSFISYSEHIDHLYTFQNNFKFQYLLKKVFRKHKICQVIPGGDDEVTYLNQILKKNKHLKRLSPFYNKFSSKSYVNKDFIVLSNKSIFIEFCEQNNILTPGNYIIPSQKEFVKNLKNKQFPIVIKLDFGVAGVGVKICNNYSEAIEGYAQLVSKMSKTSIISTLKEKVKSILDLPLDRKNQNISWQRFVKGSSYIREVFASEGKILSAVTFLKLQSFPNLTSPSTVVQVTEDDRIKKIVDLVISKTKYTGFASFDFIMSKQGPVIIECNPRPTALSHISQICGGNFCEAIKVHLGEDIKVNLAPKVIHPVIALFPNELKRDASSSYINESYHDVPYNDKKLLNFLNKDLFENNIPPITSE